MQQKPENFKKIYIKSFFFIFLVIILFSFNNVFADYCSWDGVTPGGDIECDSASMNSCKSRSSYGCTWISTPIPTPPPSPPQSSGYCSGYADNCQDYTNQDSCIEDESCFWRCIG